ncbi:hypothetical protein K435DRAFT_666059 [Dendrothele bispora CBS 962.96]|uniref:Autophagy-related protein 27 n=1 Tax=Dendrothele bispora (strain CBS 962.96) TaxID=1314807 RepID=A0A4S8M0U0_DENBC|nr:hypothetical protein K435DRAFT_666059 [Dendrothele bispora CBS 962.96]
MILLQPLSSFPSFFLFLLWTTSLVFANEDSSFSCQFSIGPKTFNLTSLTGEHTVNRTRSTPPTTMRDVLIFNLCDDLETSDKMEKRDQCPEGTRACLTKINLKDDSERIISVIPIAQTSSLNEMYTMLPSSEGLSLILHGARYPNSSEASSSQQYLNLTLLCDRDATDSNSIEFKSYNGSELHLEWQTSAVCTSGDDHDQTGDGREGNDSDGRSYGSGLGWFFLVLLLAFAAYFGLGAYYNYTTYGASGMDLIPHRDFWKEVPYLLSDVVSHLCSSVRSRRPSNRGGYIAV